MSTSMSLFISPLVIGLCRRKSTRLTAVMGGLITALGCLFTSFASQFHQLFFSYGMMIGKICIWIISCLFSRLSVVFLFVYKTDVTFFVDMLNSKLNALATYSISEVNYYFSCICDSILASQECIFNHTEKRVVSNTYLAVYNLHYKYAWKNKRIKTIFSKTKPTLPCQDTNYIYWKKFFIISK